MSDAHLTQRPYDDDGELIELTGEPIQLSNRDPENGSRRSVFGSRRWRWAMGIALAVGVLGAGALGSVAWRVAQQKDADLATPPEVAGLTRDSDERARSTADYLRSGLAANIDLDRSFGNVYNDKGQPQRPVLIFGGTTLLWQPERDLDTLFELMADEAGAVDGLREVPAGRLGGTMKCGTTSGDGGDFAVCGWADHGSVVMALFPGRPVDEAGTLLRTIREEIQTRR
ncbi:MULTISPECIES: hypothetical protein [Micromonospora]|uniref:Uncharacterized protein n=1 Tax=Micromonospora yangpuensis TaxID=683228 RepID=A0A1C6V530_9ACTN|nr:hypothetical protein [Micromonospora yangpuensis]SCL61442.1 hypothetical protein GA0070617_4666 [Micromonospora yangpuensis]